LPILISVSLAPVSYFFCASAPLADAANNANAAIEAIAFLLAKTAMTFSLWSTIRWLCWVAAFLTEGSFHLLAYHFTVLLTTKSPPQAMRRAASLVGVDGVAIRHAVRGAKTSY
jgi:hypothetical protein